MSDHPRPEDDLQEPYVSRIDRRTTLAWFTAAATSFSTVARAQSPNDRAEKPVEAGAHPARGYGTDPELTRPKPAPWPRLLTPAQLQTAAVLCDFILPASADAPSANALGVPDFIDEWVSAPYPQQVADRRVILDGLAWLEDRAKALWGRYLPRLAPADRVALLTPLTVRTTDPAMQAPHAFFRRFRSLTVGAYYSTKSGFKDIGYIGNVARPSDPGPSPEAQAAVDAALKRLGL